MGLEQKIDRRSFLRLAGWSAGTVVLGAATYDGEKDIFSPSQDEPYRIKDTLWQEKNSLLEQIANSRDAQQNAVTRERVAIVDRDLNQAYRDIVDHEGPILCRFSSERFRFGGKEGNSHPVYQHKFPV